MDATDFCHWLNGRCRLHPANLTGDQVDLVKEHLKLVFDGGSKSQPGAMLEFCKWFSGVLEFHPNHTPFNEDQFVSIRTRLYGVLDEVADRAAYPDEPVRKVLC